MRIVCPDPNGSSPNQGPFYHHSEVHLTPFKPQKELHEELGRSLWKELHEQTEPTKKWFANWLARVPNSPTCGGCLKWATDWITIPGNEPDYYNWQEWTVRFHNAVNAKLNKPFWTIPK